MRLKIIYFLSSVWLLTGCYVTKPLEELTFPNNSGLTLEENFANQLAALKQGDELNVVLKSGEELQLKHNFIGQDTLVAFQDERKNTSQIKVPLNEIQSVEVKRINALASIGLITITAIGVLVIFSLFNGFNVSPW